MRKKKWGKVMTWALISYRSHIGAWNPRLFSKLNHETGKEVIRSIYWLCPGKSSTSGWCPKFGLFCLHVEQIYIYVYFCLHPTLTLLMPVIYTQVRVTDKWSYKLYIRLLLSWLIFHDSKPNIFSLPFCFFYFLWDLI